MILVHLMILLFFSDVHPLFYPTSETISWSPLHPEKIECQVPVLRGELEDAKKIKGLFPILRKEYTVSGFLCESVTLITQCEEGLFGGTNILYIERHNNLSEDECVTAVHNFKKGRVTIANYPPSDCSWMSVNIKTETFITVKSHQMILDPYSNQVVSEIFPHNRCSQPYCETIYAHRGWISDDQYRTMCKPDHLDTTVFYIKENDGKHLEFWSPDVSLSNGRNVCIMDYCGVSGILFQDGSWIGLAKEEIKKQTSNINTFFYDMKLCPNGTKISQVESHHSTHVGEQKVMEKFLELNCEKTKEKLLVGDPISRIDLQSLTPQSPGIHNVYRLKNGTLEMGLSYYQEVKLIAPVSSNPVIAISMSGKRIKWNYWSYDSIHNILDGPNGIFMIKGTVYSALDSVSSYKSALSRSLKLKITIEPPTSHKIPQSSLKINEKYFYHSGTNQSLSDLVFSGVHNAFNWLGGTTYQLLLFLLIGFLIILGLYCLIPRLGSCRRNQVSSDIPLRVIYKPT